MSGTALFTKSASELREGYLKKEFSPTEVVQAFKTHLLASNEQLNSFISIADDELLEEAARAEELLAKEGEASPLLSGIPIAVKDCIATKQMRTTCASKMLAKYHSPFDATVITRLRRKGALLLGKTNLDEFAMGSSSEYSCFGPVKNPWDENRVAGGTSGGSAAAVAAAQAPVSLGSDTGGSIRQPAAFCGVFGLKPSYGRVSRYGLVAHASSFDQVGPLARNVKDIAMTLQAIAGTDSHDSTSSTNPVPDYLLALAKYKKGLDGLRIGIPSEYFGDGIDEDVRQQVENGAKVLQNLGAELKEVSLPNTKYALATYYIITPAEASSNLARYDGVHYGYRTQEARSLSELYSKSRSEAFGPEVKRRILIGTFVLSTGYYDAYYKKAQQVRTLIIDDFRAAFANHCDLLLTPTTPTTAFSIGERDRSPLAMYRADIFTVPASIAGLPALSMPCGFDSKGLPIGMQLIAPAFEEAELLAVAEQFSQASQSDIPSTWSTLS